MGIEIINSSLLSPKIFGEARTESDINTEDGILRCVVSTILVVYIDLKEPEIGHCKSI